MQEGLKTAVSGNYTVNRSLEVLDIWFSDQSSAVPGRENQSGLGEFTGAGGVWECQL